MDTKSVYLYGNEKLLSFFVAALEKGKMAHAYIFEGGRGSGKHTLARRLACMLACNSLLERPCFMCESCRKISEGISPDVIEVSLNDDKKTIGVEQIRSLRSSVYVKPSEEDIKVYIISNAETMTEQAQNVFLKVLEEPPRGVYFFMLCENTSNILPTIKSRAPVLKMQNFTDKEIKDFLLVDNKGAIDLMRSNEEELDLIIRIAEGKIGEAERLISFSKSDKSQSKHMKAKRLIELISDITNYHELVLYVQNIATTRDELLDVLLYSLYAVRDLMTVKRTENGQTGLVFYSNVEEAENTAAGLTSAGVMKIYEELSRTREEVALNVNLSNTLMNLAYKLQEAANI